jgi:hypothetical protein
MQGKGRASNGPSLRKIFRSLFLNDFFSHFLATHRDFGGPSTKPLEERAAAASQTSEK